MNIKQSESQQDTGMSRMQRLRRCVGLLAISFLLLGSSYLAQAAGQPAPWEGQSVAQRVENIRSITYYPYPAHWIDFDLARYKKSLDDMKEVGVNTVWLIIPWYEFQSQALPTAEWIPGALENLKKAVTVAEEKKLNVILPLCYLGDTWAPKGINARIWTLDTAMYQAFERYVKSLTKELDSHRNIIYLLYTEDCHPYMQYVRQYPIAYESFRAWCKSVNPDVAYWNQRWGTKYTWATLLPCPPDEHFTKARIDYWRWSASLLRERHGGLARKMKKDLGDRALVGYHDWNILAANFSDGDTPIPTENNPYDLMSMNTYHAWSPDKDRLTRYETSIHEIAKRFRAKHPGLPLALLECGAATYQVGFDEQAEAIGVITKAAKEERMGVNIWMWQDFMGKANSLSECSFGFLGPDGSHKPSYDVLRKAWKQ